MNTDADPALPAVTSETIIGGGGLNLTVYEGGYAGGPAIVFIHGFTGSFLSWQPQLSGSLAEEFRLVAYDFRGHGASDKPLEPANYTAGTLWADDLDAVIRAKQLDRPVLIGWSYGGYVISDYLRTHGDSEIGGLVFVGANTKNGTAEAAGYLTDDVLALFGDVLAADVQKSIDARARPPVRQPTSRSAVGTIVRQRDDGSARGQGRDVQPDSGQRRCARPHPCPHARHSG